MVKITLETKEALRRYSQLINIRFPAIIIFLLAALFLKIFFKIHFSNLFFFLISFMAISTIIYDFIFSQVKEKTASLIVNGYFLYLLFDLIILTMIIYLIGGVTWIGFVFYALYIYISFLLFPRIYSFFCVVYCSFLYTLLVVLQYLGIFSWLEFFHFTERVPQNFSYVLSSWIAAILFFWMLGYYGDVFSRSLEEKIEELQRTKTTLEEERMSLEIRVRARTRELWEERKSLAEKVKERTKELEKERKELAKKIVELEKFHKLTVGRELKMRELKKEVEKMKEELKNKGRG